MPTINQLCNQIRQLKKRLVRTPALENSPQRKGICLKIFIESKY